MNAGGLHMNTRPHASQRDGDQEPAEGGLDRRRLLQAAGLGGFAALALPAFQAHGAVVRPEEARIVSDLDAQRLWYRAPASEEKMIEEGLPIGNGRLGGLVGGGPDNTAFFLTDASIWSGDTSDALDDSGQFPYDREGFGTFQLLSKARLRISGHTPQSISDYERALDLSNGVLVTTYRVNGVTYRQEFFSSHPDDVIVVRLTQSGGGSLAGTMSLEPTRDETLAVDSRQRRLDIADDLGNGLRYAVAAGVASSRGNVVAKDQLITFSDAREVVIVISGGSNYRPDSTIGYRDSHLDVAGVARTKLQRALRVSGSELLSTHTADYRRSFETFELDLGRSSAEQRALDTGARLVRRAEPGSDPDPEFDLLYLQLSRYLTITGSRDGLPTNLQGLWLDNNQPDWMSDYHTDINIQMNYWPTHRYGLSKNAEPLLNYCLSQLPQWSKQTRELYNDPRNRFRNSSGRIAGWTLAISTNIYGGNGWWWNPAGNAWLCLELWQHYEYTLDRRYLERLMPLLRGTVEFWETRLIELTIGDRTVLVSDKGWSPEQGPQDGIGNSYDQELVHAVFGYFIEASKLLGSDKALAAKAEDMRDRLYLPVVSPTTGWLEEWMSPDNLGEKQHRHLSGLIGWYPGDRIRFDNQSAEYVDGVRKVLEARGFESYGWACAWRAACWARLKDANRAYNTLSYVLRPANGHLGGSGINLFDLYQTNRYIFQIDANFGVAAAMMEMLVHAKTGVIDLMPAVPAAWKNGSVRGMGVRGGFTLDMTWTDGIPRTVTLHSVGGTTTEVRVGDWKKTVRMQPGKSVSLQPMGVPSPPPPPPPPPPPAMKIINVGSGLGMEVYGGSSDAGANIAQWTYSGSTSQTWHLLDVPDGYVSLQSVRSELFIDIPNGQTAEGTDVIQWGSSGSPSQQWKIEDAGSGQVRIVSRITDKVLGVAGASTALGASVEIQADSGDPSQRWTVAKA